MRKPPHLIALRHLGLVVSDFKAMVDFYLKLGFKSRLLSEEKGKSLEQLTGIENLHIYTAKLYLPEEDLEPWACFNLEIMANFRAGLSPTPEKSDSLDHKRRDGYITQSGFYDLSLTVSDIYYYLKLITALGGKTVNPPVKTETGHPALHAYAKDLEGNILHLAENLE